MNIIYLRTKDHTLLYRAYQNENGTYTVEGFRSNEEEKKLDIYPPTVMAASEFTKLTIGFFDSNERQYYALKQMYASWYDDSIKVE